MTNKTFLTLTITILLAVFMLTNVQAAPPIPATYWGTATVDGAPASDGTVIEAVLNDSTLAETTVFTYEGNQGMYLIEIAGDDPDTPEIVEGASANDLIAFRVANEQANQDIAWQSGVYEQLDLSADSVPSSVHLRSFSDQRTMITPLIAVLICLIAITCLIRHWRINMLLLLLAVIGTSHQAIEAAPPIPATFWGVVRDAEGSVYADGTPIAAFIDDIEYASGVIFTDSGMQGLYFLEIPGDDPDTPSVVEGGVAGDVISFVVDGVTANETVIWQSGDYRQQNLTVPSTATPIVAAFSADNLTGTAPLTVTFQDQSTGEITAWSWTFGDGTSSSSQHPTHSYDTVGIYDVALTVSGADSSDTVTKTAFIHVTEQGATPPTLSLPTDAVAPPYATIEMPLTFSGQSYNITTMVFSLDYDSSCLWLPQTDNNHDDIPDAISFNLPFGYQASAEVDLADEDGELDFFIADLFPPFVPLSDSVIATMQFDLLCSAEDTLNNRTALNFASDPAASFGNRDGQSVAGVVEDGVIEILSGTSGDCNADTRVDAGDIAALALEIFDNDGVASIDVGNGTFAGDPIGCDANGEQVIDAGDITCTVLLIYEGSDACSDAAPITSDVPSIALPSETHALPNTTMTLPISLDPSIHALSAVAFSLDIDETLLNFDPADDDNDGIPDSISFNIPSDFSYSVTYDASDSDGELDFFIADLFQPIHALSADEIVTVTLAVTANATADQTAYVRFATETPPSFGTDDGISQTGNSSDGIVVINTIPTAVQLQTMKTPHQPLFGTLVGAVTALFGLTIRILWLRFANKCEL